MRVAEIGLGLTTALVGYRSDFAIESFAGGKTMWDIGCVVASMLFFAVAIGYAMGCDRLGVKETQR